MERIVVADFKWLKVTILIDKEVFIYSIHVWLQENTKQISKLSCQLTCRPNNPQ